MHYRKKAILRLAHFSCSSITALSAVAFSQDKETISNSPLEELVVISSTRTGTDLASTPAAVSALSAKAMTAAGISDATSLQELAPNISIDRAASSGLQITIRGVSSTDNSEKGDPSAAFLMDGIYIARPQAQELSFFDLEQVEVLRGPQGTLYGRNATAGLVNVIAAKPTMDGAYGAIDGTLGDYDKTQATGMLNLPLSDSAAIRAAINIDKRDTYLNKFPESPYKLAPGKDNLSFRLSGLFDLGDDMDLLLRADHSSMDGSGRSAVNLSNFFDTSTITPSTSGRGEDPTYIGDSRSSDELRTIGWSDTQRESIAGSTWGVMSELNWALSEQLTTTYLGSYRELKRREDKLTVFVGNIPSGGDSLSIHQRFNGDYEQKSHELRLTYTTDTMNLQTGLYYFREESSIEVLIFGNGGTMPGDDGYVFGFPQDPTISESVAVFAQGAFDLSEKLTLTLGARQTEDEKSRVGAAIQHRNLGEDYNFTQDPVTNPLADSLNNAKVDYKELTWKAGLDYKVSDSLLIYGTVSTGYKAGGFNDGCIEGTPNCSAPLPEAAVFYNPETLTAYEAGVKIDLENGLRTFVSIFNYDYQDLQLSRTSDVCGGPCQVTSNAGEADITGIELESRYFINPQNRLNVALTWLDAEYTDYQLNATTNLRGDSLNRSPEYTAIIGYQYVVPLPSGADIVFDTNLRWSDEYAILTTPVPAQFVQPSFSKTDFSITYNSSDERWYLQGFIKNIEDEVTIAYATMGPLFPTLEDGTVNISDPRTSGVRFGIKF